MGLINLASNKSVWRGIDYHERKKVITWTKDDEGIYSGQVSGSNGEIYSVHVDTLHPRSSTCNCPFAEGRRVICKHMLAIYFSAEPEVLKQFLKEVEEWEAEEELRVEQYYEDMEKYVYSLSKEELQIELLNALMELEEKEYW